MDVRSIQPSPVFTGTVRNHGGRVATEEPTGTPSQDERSRTGNTPVLSADEKSFFEGLFPESRKDIRAYQAYSGTGEQQKSAPTGTLVDRKG
jgi:hypothetical protein